MELIVSYESIRCGLNIDAQVVIDTIVDKTWTFRFFILYNNMNIYEGSHDQRIHNCSTVMSYMAKYVCFMKTPGSTNDSNDTWVERYMDANQINWTLMNKFGYDNFELSKKNRSHPLAAVCYNFSKVLNQFFLTAIQK